jgi:(4-(4-[2-(gamma-L-glutamylamino)ethyl]phenoxymethyl)furan-2-yl)methanamine synthase
MTITTGWDIGGVHIKCARYENERLTAARQVPCQLWLGLEHLTAAVAELRPMLDGAGRHAVTMTGELAEVFASRAEGVRTIVDMIAAALAPAPLVIYGGRAGFLTPDEARAQPDAVASANWHATAAFIAARLGKALLIDIGSTTCDIIPVVDGIAARGYSDGERLTTGELVYTGAIRTSVMAIAAQAPFGGLMHRVTAENFSTMADVYRLTGELRPDEDQYPASDGRGKTHAECRARLARMLGRDAGEASDAAWDALARFLRERQLALVYEAAAQVLSGTPLPPDAPVAGAGAGDFISAEIAARLRRPYVSVGDLFEAASGDIRRHAVLCGPAAALAWLAGTAGGR